MSKIVRLTESDLIRLVKKVINENQSQDMVKIKEFVDEFKPLGVMWVQDEFDKTAVMSPSPEVGVGERISFIRKDKPEIKCKLRNGLNGYIIRCQDKNGSTDFNLNTEFVKFKKWISNYVH